MGKALVLYRSKYGATKKYAAMLAEEYPCDVYELGQYHGAGLESYDWVIFAGGIYASGISGLSVLRREYQKLDHRKLVIFCVGASPFDEKSFAAIQSHNLKGDLKDIPVFYGRGAWDESKMTWKDRTLCRLLQKAVAKKDPASCEPWMQALISAAGQRCDWTDRSYLVPLLDYLNGEGTQAR